MKPLSAIALTLLLLLAGCRQQAAVSPRLVELDSLIAVAPDSAAALLAAIPADSLITPENRAYHALLTTQAKYKAYIPFGEGALDTINMAVRYYSDGRDTEKNTRSNLYKGCVFEGQQQLDSAMYYYKAAEDLATQSGNTYHRGYALMRMASLFRDNYANREAIGLLDEALNCFLLTNDSIWQLNATLSLASQYQTTNLDSAFLYVNQALSLSKSLDSLRYDDCLCTLASCHLLHRDYRSCVSVASESVRQATNREAYFKSCHWTAQAYAMMGMKDSGEYFLGIATPPYDMADSVLYLRSKALLSANPNQYKVQSSNIADTLVDITTITALKDAMNSYTSSKTHQAINRASQRQHFFIFISIIMALLLLLIIYLSIQANRRANNQHRKEVESKEREIMVKNALIQHQQNEIQDKEERIITGIQTMQSQREEILAKDEAINAFMQKVDTLNDQLRQVQQDACQSEANNKTEHDSHKENIVGLIEQLKQQIVEYHKRMVSNGSKKDDIVAMTRRMLNESFCDTLVKSLRSVYPYLATLLDNENLTTKDAAIICMHLAMFPNAIIRDFMGVEREHSVTNKKRELARILNLKSLDSIKQPDNI